MKRISIRLLILMGVLASLIISCTPTCDPDYYTTITTPNNTSLSAIKRPCESNSSTIQQNNQYVETTYPNATRETDSSRQYNCHSYAWHNQSHSNDIWINTPNQETYWNDGSYVYVDTTYGGTNSSSAANGARVDYASDDHSAIKVSSSNFRSKWGQLPRMLHAPDYTPYNENRLDFYEEN